MKRRRAFVFIEFLMTLPILVIAFALGVQLFRDVILTDAASASVSNHFSQTDAAIYRLRQDVWNSQTIKIASPNEAQLTLADGKIVSWRIESDGAASRLDWASRSLRWQSAADGWSFSQNSTCLIVAATTNRDVQQIQLVSQILAGGKS